MYEDSTILLNQMCEMLIKKHDECHVSSGYSAFLLLHIWIKMMLQHLNEASSGHVKRLINPISMFALLSAVFLSKFFTIQLCAVVLVR